MGLIGIKPQFGRVPIFPPSATPNLAHVGPVARNSADAALLLSIISGPDQRDWTSLQQPVGDIAKNTEGLRIAFSPTLGYAKVAAEVAECVNDAVRKLSTEFSQVEEVAFVCEDADQFLAGSSWLASAPVSTNLAQQTVSWTRQRSERSRRFDRVPPHGWLVFSGLVSSIVKRFAGSLSASIYC